MSLFQDLVIAYRVLADYGIIDAYGHISVRCPDNPNRFWMARSVAPELVTEADMMEFDMESEPVDARGRSPVNERYIHGEVYKARPEVMAVVHNHSPSVIPFCCSDTPLQPIFHMSAFIGLGVPNWEIREAREGSDMLVRDNYLGASLARRLGNHPAALMRGHGAVVVGESLQIAVGRSVYLEQNARMQFQAELLAGPGGKITFMDEKEVAANVVWQEYGRFWNLVRNKYIRKLEEESA
ncbi:HCOMODA/2-hydroxy-3-carboxy-muconic semialdehyde decarboxylase [Noviherbaspirillum humi]|uniref:HCOMODA/2-hydroxy-3-carboxy-muconic semialdehyde decarboxylase n=1 Tax=Noviherbaspirillum humi TaxID=1688639 RepID=A0A239M6L2_9BURK|nr:class II aldolase/adducin family protein [Noviherbaspirillum humi]SNT38251.1 HCOMODA/2-hydroxy-3-carboxy-muconic semialdehyde decarboxylase [Noviherbaspirillum humi]